jgi:hypothetical protein
MSKFAIGLLTLGMYATTLAVVPVVTPAEAATNSKHKKHQRTAQRRPAAIRDSWAAGQAWPVARPSSPAGGVCPGLARSFDCKIWPPPFEDDPDRRVSGSDGG